MTSPSRPARRPFLAWHVQSSLAVGLVAGVVALLVYEVLNKPVDPLDVGLAAVVAGVTQALLFRRVRRSPQRLQRELVALYAGGGLPEPATLAEVLDATGELEDFKKARDAMAYFANGTIDEAALHGAMREHLLEPRSWEVPPEIPKLSLPWNVRMGLLVGGTIAAAQWVTARLMDAPVDWAQAVMHGGFAGLVFGGLLGRIVRNPARTLRELVEVLTSGSEPSLERAVELVGETGRLEMFSPHRRAVAAYVRGEISEASLMKTLRVLSGIEERRED